MFAHLPLLSIPVTIPLFTWINHKSGPKRLLQLTNQSADKLSHWLIHTPLAYTQPDIPRAERWIWRISHICPKAACLERACALKTFLAFWGTPSTIVIGHDNTNSNILLHAWLETENTKYFYDEKFSANWRSDNDVLPSIPNV